jgi:glycosyltransferase involved in cell wall biosynthesis
VPNPRLAVVVPAHDAAATLPRTLAALSAQDYAGEWELVVVDDASGDATGALAETAGARVVRRDGQGGPAATRNAGVAATDAPLIAFTDADCEPVPGWLSALVAALDGADLVTGPVRPDPRAPRRFSDRTLDLAGPSPRFETANLAVRRTVYDRVGGFAPFVPRDGAPGLRPRPDQGHFGEDAVFGWTAVRLGARTAFAADALVHHAVFPRGPRGYIAERWRVRFFPALVRDVPELRRALPGRVFLSPRQRRFDAAIAGVALAAATRRPWPLALAVPYVHRHLRTRDAWRRSAARENLAHIVADGVTLAALVRGSIAARRILL